MSLDYGGLPGQLRVDALGMERCAPGHRYGPAAREYTLIHCVFSGKGEFFADGKRYALGAGQGFLICPRMLASYRADEQDPWTYGWMGYSGALAAGLTARAGLRREAPVFPVGEAAPLVEILRRAQEEMAGLRLGELGAAGGLLRFLGQIGQYAAPEQAGPPQEEYLRKAAWYIQSKLEEGVGVEEVAGYLGLCRSQLFRVVKAASGLSPREWIRRARLQRAAQLLEDGRLSLEQVALSCGYGGAAQLGQAFRKAYGQTPPAYRRACHGGQARPETPPQPRDGE